MTSDQYVLWFIGMAIAIALLLSLGTMKMAGVLKRPERTEADVRHLHEGPRHHWYDRFHIHHAA